MRNIRPAKHIDVPCIALGFAVAILVFAAIGCGAKKASQGDGSTSGPLAHAPAVRKEADGIPLLPVPRQVRTVCTKVQMTTALRVLCPSLLPRPRRGTPYGQLRAAQIGGRSKLRYMIEFDYGIEGAAATKNRPTRFLHLLLAGGDIQGFGAPLVNLPPTNPKPKLLGMRTIGSRTGDLYMQRPYSQGGGLHGNHLIFVWHQNGTRYGISLHSWGDPETFGFLTALFESLAPA